MLSAHDKFTLFKYKQLVCCLPAQGIGTMEFEIPQPRQEALVNAGQAAMAAFLD